MEPTNPPQSAFDRIARRPRLSWRRRLTERLGLQGKLVFSFSLLLAIAIGSCTLVFVFKMRERVGDLMSEQATTLVKSLATAGENALAENRTDDLLRTCHDLNNARNVRFVAVIDQIGQTIASSGDVPTTLSPMDVLSTGKFLRPTPKTSPTFGRYLEVTAPILGSNAVRGGRGQKLAGAVILGLGFDSEIRQITQIGVQVGTLAGIFCLVGIPLSWLIVKRVFLPIRELVDAAKSIAAGDLEAKVAVHRSDVIGTLARSFNDMVEWVKKQQHDLAAANEQLVEANRDLEARVGVRTQQFETANNRLSREIAEKEDFMRAVSHDLNAPLRNISGMTSMLLMKHRAKFDEDVVHRLERIQKNVEIETDLITELLELSRIKTRRGKMEPTNLEEMVWELRGLFEADLQKKAIQLVLDTPLPPVNCERARLRQVFQNLIDNAIKYMGTDQRREIHVGCTMRLTEVEFYVRDTGMGIEPEDVDKVFFVFRRGKSSAVQNIAGKGIGLASVKSIVENYAGQIRVESKVGEGSSFIFTINGQFIPGAASYVATTNDPEQEAEAA